MHVKDNSLTVGTTKVTSHIPGYRGFVPSIDINKNAYEQSKCKSPRTTFLKNNISENYNVRLVGYAGAKPANAMNDRGNMRPSCFSTEGETFK